MKKQGTLLYTIKNLNSQNKWMQHEAFLRRTPRVHFHHLHLDVICKNLHVLHSSKGNASIGRTRDCCRNNSGLPVSISWQNLSSSEHLKETGILAWIRMYLFYVSDSRIFKWKTLNTSWCGITQHRFSNFVRIRP